MNADFIDLIGKKLDAKPARSAWLRGVKEYAADLLPALYGCSMTAEAVISDRAGFMQALLSGARSWKEYSDGGCALIYDRDIAYRLCTPSAYRRSLGGERRPNRSETWLDVQARALWQAAFLLYDAACQAARTEVFWQALRAKNENM